MLPRACAFAYEFGFAGGAVYNGRGDDVTRSTVYNDIYYIFEKVVHYFGVGKVLNMPIHGQGGAHDGVAQLFYHLLAYLIVGHADADCVFFGFE